MLIRICLVIAIIAGLAAAALGLLQVKQKVNGLQDNLRAETAEKVKQTNRAKTAEKERDDTKTELASEKSAHDATKSERETAKSERDEAKRQAGELSGKLSKTEGDLRKSKQELAAWDNLGVPLEKIKATLASLKGEQDKNAALQTENKLLATKLKNTQNRLDELMGKDGVDEEVGVPMTPGLKANVKTVDPKWDFVVLDVGRNGDAKVGGIMLVNRDGKLLAKVKIQSLYDDTCVAHVMRGWKLTEIQEGDKAVH